MKVPIAFIKVWRNLKLLWYIFCGIINTDDILTYWCTSFENIGNLVLRLKVVHNIIWQNNNSYCEKCVSNPDIPEIKKHLKLSVRRARWRVDKLYLSVDEDCGGFRVIFWLKWIWTYLKTLLGLSRRRYIWLDKLTKLNTCKTLSMFLSVKCFVTWIKIYYMLSEICLES